MYCRIAYFLEKQYFNTSVPGYPFAGFESLDLFHASTNNHLLNFLEKVLSVSPHLKVRLASYLGTERLLREIPEIEQIRKIHALEIKEFPFPGKEYPAPDVSVLLYSCKVHLDPEIYKASRRAFTRSSANRKFIVHGDGSIFDGSLSSRIKRKFLVQILKHLVPLRDREEREILSRRILPDPGYDRLHPSPSRICDHHKRIALLKYPFLIEQCKNDTTIINVSHLMGKIQNRIYGSGYHFLEMTDDRPDWDALKETYQSRRLRNMKKLGMHLPGDFGPSPTALDLGCGTGSFCELLSKQGFRTLGIDCSEDTINIARRNYPHLEFKVMDVEKLTFLRRKFDLIVLSHILEHIRDDRGFLEMLKQAMKPEGFLYIEVPWMDIKALASRPFWYRQKDHYREYSKLGLYSLVSGCGYKILAHEDSLADEGNEPYQFLLARMTSQI